MFTNNPYAQGGWYNPDNPLSLNNGVWGNQSLPRPSVYGALPSACPPSPPKILTFYFLSLNPTILNCAVVGPQNVKYMDISTSSPGAPTVFRRLNDLAGIINWEHQVTVTVQDAVTMRAAAQFLELSQDHKYRSMQVRGKWYAWVFRDQNISLFTVGPSPPELLAKVSREHDTIKLEITAQAVQEGLLDATIVATVLLQCGRSFG